VIDHLLEDRLEPIGDHQVCGGGGGRLF
jgi:hypothetical protein